MTKLDHLYAEYQRDEAFAALRARTGFVPGEGAPSMPMVLFVGEAPGATEERQLRPFVGESGRLLRGAAMAAGFTEDNWWITNVVKYRPPGNRPPTPEEIAAARPYTLREMAIVSPEVVVPLGRHALQTLLPEERRGITALHGKLLAEGYRSYFPLLHPSAILRSGSEQIRRDYRSKFRELKELLG